MGFEASGIVMGQVKRHSYVWKLKEQVGFIFQTSKPHFSPRIGTENRSFKGAIVGTQAQMYIGFWALSEEA